MRSVGVSEVSKALEEFKGLSGLQGRCLFFTHRGYVCRMVFQDVQSADRSWFIVVSLEAVTFLKAEPASESLEWDTPLARVRCRAVGAGAEVDVRWRGGQHLTVRGDRVTAEWGNGVPVGLDYIPPEGW